MFQMWHVEQALIPMFDISFFVPFPPIIPVMRRWVGGTAFI